MAARHKSMADAAAAIVDKPEVKERIEREIAHSILVNTLISIRMDKGVSLVELAKRMGCSVSKVSRMESGNDLNLKWKDILKYLIALKTGLSMMFRDRSLPAAIQIKQLELIVGKLLTKLVEIAKQVQDDSDFINEIKKFCGDMFMDFSKDFHETYKQLVELSVLEINQEVEVASEDYDQAEDEEVSKEGVKEDHKATA